MGICRDCNFYTNGICPSGTPWRDRCILDDEDNKEEITVAKSRKVVYKTDNLIDPNMEKKIVEAVRNGFSYEQITKQYGVTKYRVTEIKRKHGLLKEGTKKESVKKEQVRSKQNATFIFKSDGKKPHKACYPYEKDGFLVWAIDITSIEDLLDVADSFKDKALVIHKRELDIVDLMEKK